MCFAERSLRLGNTATAFFFVCCLLRENESNERGLKLIFSGFACVWYRNRPRQKAELSWRFFYAAEFWSSLNTHKTSAQRVNKSVGQTFRPAIYHKRFTEMLIHLSLPPGRWVMPIDSFDAEHSARSQSWKENFSPSSKLRLKTSWKISANRHKQHGTFYAFRDAIFKRLWSALLYISEMMNDSLVNFNIFTSLLRCFCLHSACEACLGVLHAMRDWLKELFSPEDYLSN